MNNNRFRPKEITAVSLPVTARNSRNAQKNPILELGNCTPFQIFHHINFDYTGTICVIGNPSKGIGIALAMIRRIQTPFLMIGPAADRHSAFMVLEPEWTIESVQRYLPSGNGAIFLSQPCSSYLEICEYLEEWMKDHFLILHLSGGVQIGPEVINLLNAARQCLIFCDSVPQSLRNNESRMVMPKEFLSQMSCLFVFSAGAVTKDLVDLFPTYQYEKVSNTLNVNSFKNHPLFHPFHLLLGNGISWGQTRSMEFRKSVLEMDELDQLFDQGILLVFSVRSNRVYLANLI